MMDAFLSSTYRFALSFYPLAFRQEFESEMLAIVQERLANERRSLRKCVVLFGALLELTPWILKENGPTLTHPMSTLPNVMKKSVITSVLLLVPALYLALYNLFIAHTHHAVPQMLQLFNHGWLVYSLILPLIAFILTSISVLWYARKLMRKYRTSLFPALYQMSKIALMIFVTLGGLEVKILL